MSTTLTVTEKNRLSAAESDIEHGGRLMVTALATIRDERLYRGEYDTFEAYCRARWGIGRNYVNKIIRRDEVVKNLTDAGLGTNCTQMSEGAARQVADLPAEKQVEIVKKATADGKKPTAKAVKAAREKVAPKVYNDEFDPKKLDKPKVHRADADMPPMQLDETGAEVPKPLIGVFERREQFRKASRMVRDAAGIVKVLKGETAGRYLSDEADCLEHLASEIEASMPHSVDGRTWRCARG